ncbi:MAG: flagellar basal body P-ring protein FlgI [Syntrophobacteraceae bacterium]|nr:flagellar basal body P-ring protein FlgI [Syntrophobacteraceae bacterium]
MTNKGRVAAVITSTVLVLLLSAGAARSARIKDIAYFLGDRSNDLIGYGLVVGLKNTGDDTSTPFTIYTLQNLLNNMGIQMDPTKTTLKNVAAVMVTGRLPAFSRVGSRIDVQASSIGDATSLGGGTLLMTQLKGSDGKVYAVAQGPLSIGGFAASGQSGSSVQQNHPTVGLITSGGTIEKEVSVRYNGLHTLDLVLRTPDFTTAQKMAQAISRAIPQAAARPVDAGTIRLEVPPSDQNDTVNLISKVENLEVTPDVIAKVVIDERTGTIVMGQNVRIAPCAVAHGSLTVQITEKPTVSQPLPFSNGKTTVVPRTGIKVQQQKAHLAVIGGGVTIGQVVSGLNAIGATPLDLINILEAIKASGAMSAELQII